MLAVMDEATITIVATIIASVVSIIVGKWTTKSDDRRAIEDQISQLLDLTMQYPFVEYQSTIEAWPNPNLSDEDSIRYKNYCCFAFNLIERLRIHYWWNPGKMYDVLHIKEILWLHRAWWRGDPENKIGYDEGFRVFIDSTINAMERERQG